MTRILVLASLCALFPTISLNAQIRKAPQSPKAQQTQMVGLAKVTLNYSRPGVKGRKIFGALEPWGKVWRTGANACTTIEFDRAVRVGGKDVPAGKYSLFTIPGKNEWQVILNRATKLWGAGGYDPAKDQLRIKVKPAKLTRLKETFTIDFEGFHANGANLTIAWEKTIVSVEVFVDSDSEVMKEIDQKVRQGRASAQSLFDAGMYLFEKNKDLKQAEEWVGKAVEMNGRAFWFRYYLAEIQLARKNKTMAKENAEQVLKVAQAAAHDYGYAAKCKLLLAKIK